MLRAASVIVAKNQKQPKCPSSGEWIKNCGIFIEWNEKEQTNKQTYTITWINLKRKKRLSKIS